jgi:hypothetical protein
MHANQTGLAILPGIIDETSDVEPKGVLMQYSIIEENVFFLIIEVNHSCDEINNESIDNIESTTGTFIFKTQNNIKTY